MRIGLVTDVHYCNETVLLNRRFPQRALARLREAVDAFTRAGADLIVCLGDLIDVDTDAARNERHLRTASQILTASGLPCVCIMGNHDRAVFSPEAFAAISQLQLAPCSLFKDGIALHFLDTGYLLDGTPYQPGHVDWTQTLLPPDGLARIQSAMANHALRHFFFFHQCLDPHVERRHIVHNAEEINALLLTGRTAAVFQGHFHPGMRSVIGGIPYVTLPALCEGEKSGALLIDTDDYPA